MTNTKQLLLTYMDALRAFDKVHQDFPTIENTRAYSNLIDAEDALLDRDTAIESLLQSIADSYGGDPMNNVHRAECALALLRGEDEPE